MKGLTAIAFRNDVMVGAATVIFALYELFRDVKEHGWSWRVAKR